MRTRLAVLCGLGTIAFPTLMKKLTDSIPDPTILPVGAKIPTALAVVLLLLGAVISAMGTLYCLIHGDRKDD